MLLGSLLSTLAAAQSEAQCYQYVLYREARGEGILTQRAVLDVLHNRKKRSGKSICSLAREPFQFPYVAETGIKVVDKKFRKRYAFIVGVEPVLSKNYLYFNHVKHPWGRNTVRLGKLYFST